MLAAHALYYPLRDGRDVIGAPRTIVLHYEDTFAAIAQQRGLGYLELIEANPDVDPWLPGEGTEIILPTAYVLPDAPRRGVIINLPEFRMYYFVPGADAVVTFPVGIGRTTFPTPETLTTIVGRIENPSWTPTPSIRAEHLARGDKLPPVVKPGPDNPLGHYALSLAIPGYFIHGTNQPFGVGQRVSHGCIRLYATHIETLLQMAPNGTEVRIIDQRYKAGWRNGSLYLESHPPLDGNGADTADMVATVIRALGDRQNVEVDWEKAEAIAKNARGIPARISQ